MVMSYAKQKIFANRRRILLFRKVLSSNEISRDYYFNLTKKHKNEFMLLPAMYQGEYQAVFSPVKLS